MKKNHIALVISSLLMTPFVALEAKSIKERAKNAANYVKNAAKKVEGFFKKGKKTAKNLKDRYNGLMSELSENTQRNPHYMAPQYPVNEVVQPVEHQHEQNTQNETSDIKKSAPEETALLIPVNDENMIQQAEPSAETQQEHKSTELEILNVDDEVLDWSYTTPSYMIQRAEPETDTQQRHMEHGHDRKADSQRESSMQSNDGIQNAETNENMSDMIQQAEPSADIQQEHDESPALLMPMENNYEKRGDFQEGSSVQSNDEMQGERRVNADGEEYFVPKAPALPDTQQGHDESPALLMPMENNYEKRGDFQEESSAQSNDEMQGERRVNAEGEEYFVPKAPALPNTVSTPLENQIAPIETAPQIPTPPSPSNAHEQLMREIRKGGTGLRKTTDVRYQKQNHENDARTQLMNDIKSGVKLKKVTPSQPTETARPSTPTLHDQMMERIKTVTPTMNDHENASAGNDDADWEATTFPGQLED